MFLSISAYSVVRRITHIPRTTPLSDCELAWNRNCGLFLLLSPASRKALGTGLKRENSQVFSDLFLQLCINIKQSRTSRSVFPRAYGGMCSYVNIFSFIYGAS